MAIWAETCLHAKVQTLIRTPQQPVHVRVRPCRQKMENDAAECRSETSPADVAISPADISHLDQLVPLFLGYLKFYKQELNSERTKAFLEQRFKNKDSKIFVATQGDVGIVGFVQLYPLLDSLKLGNCWLLNDLYVDPQHRGKGYSKKLLQQAKELAEATNSTGLLLETQITNDIGNKLYPSQGWEPAFKEFNFYWWTSKKFSPMTDTGLVKSL